MIFLDEFKHLPRHISKKISKESCIDLSCIDHDRNRIVKLFNQINSMGLFNDRLKSYSTCRVICDLFSKLLRFLRHPVMFLPESSLLDCLLISFSSFLATFADPLINFSLSSSVSSRYLAIQQQLYFHLTI